MAFTIGGFFELAKSCLALSALSVGSPAASGAPLPIMAADALVNIAMAEPVTVA